MLRGLKSQEGEEGEGGLANGVCWSSTIQTPLESKGEFDRLKRTLKFQQLHGTDPGKALGRLPMIGNSNTSDLFTFTSLTVQLWVMTKRPRCTRWMSGNMSGKGV